MSVTPENNVAQFWLLTDRSLTTDQLLKKDMATTETPLSNGNGSAALAVPDISAMSPEALKALRSQIAKHDRAKSKFKQKAKPAIKPIKSVKPIQIPGNLIEDGVDFDLIENELFSFDTIPTGLWRKSGKERALNLRTGKSKAVGSAIVYPVIL